MGETGDRKQIMIVYKDSKDIRVFKHMLIFRSLGLASDFY